MNEQIISGDSVITEKKEISITTPSPNSAPKKIITGLIIGGFLGGGISYFVNKKFIVTASIIGAIAGAIIYNKYQK